MQAKAYKGLGMEGWIARWYARNTGKDLSEFVQLAARIAGRLAPGRGSWKLRPAPATSRSS